LVSGSVNGWANSTAYDHKLPVCWSECYKLQVLHAETWKSRTRIRTFPKHFPPWTILPRHFPQHTSSSPNVPADNYSGISAQNYPPRTFPWTICPKYLPMLSAEYHSQWAGWLFLESGTVHMLLFMSALTAKLPNYDLISPVSWLTLLCFTGLCLSTHQNFC